MRSAARGRGHAVFFVHETQFLLSYGVLDFFDSFLWQITWLFFSMRPHVTTKLKLTAMCSQLLRYSRVEMDACEDSRVYHHSWR